MSMMGSSEGDDGMPAMHCEPRMSTDVLTWRLTGYLAQCLQSIAARSGADEVRRGLGRILPRANDALRLALVTIEAADRRVLACRCLLLVAIEAEAGPVRGIMEGEPERRRHWSHGLGDVTVAADLTRLCIGAFRPRFVMARTAFRGLCVFRVGERHGAARRRVAHGFGAGRVGGGLLCRN